jgi:hypothetical protein
VAILPPLVVNAPEPRGLRYGLLIAASGPLELPQHGLSAGLIYEPVSCGHARLYPIECPAGVTPTVKVFDPLSGFVTANPFVAYASLQCGAVGNTADSMRTKVLRRLANGEQSVAEEGMATVLAAGATVVVAPDADDIRSVIGALEQRLYGDDGVAYGNVGYLHMPPRYANYAGSHGILFKDGNLWRTHMGTVVVFGGGYPDNGSIYITGHTTVWRAADVTVPDPEQTFDRSANQYFVLAEREYAVAYDCVAAVAQFIPAGES